TFFCFCCIIFTTYNCTCVSHCTSFWCCFSSDKPNNRFCSVFFDPFSSQSFQITTNLTDHDNSFCFRISHKHLNSFFSCCTDDRVSSDTNCSSDSHSCFYNLISCFVCKG